MAEDPAGRYHLVQVPAFSPAEDFITKTTVGPFVDTGASTGQYIDRGTGKMAEKGRLYLSVSTIRELAEVAGLFDVPSEVDELIGGLEVRFTADSLAAEYNRGYDDATKENLVGHLRDTAAELVAAADRLAGDLGPALGEGGEDVAASDAPGAGDLGDANEADRQPVGDRPGDLLEGGDQAAAPAPRPRGQGNGPRKGGRPARVPSDSGDGASKFAI